MWLIIAALFLSGVLGYTVAIARATRKTQADLIWQIERVAYIKAQYEQQKTELYKLGTRHSEDEINTRSRLQTLEDSR